MTYAVLKARLKPKQNNKRKTLNKQNKVAGEKVLMTQEGSCPPIKYPLLPLSSQ